MGDRTARDPGRMPDERRKILVTGAAGVVGSEVLRQLGENPDLDVTGCSARGRPAAGVVAWAMGRDPIPPELRGKRWDAVIHAAATTRWTQTPDEAIAGNLRPAQTLAAVVSDETHVVALSTSHVVGVANRPWSGDVGDFRNAYEWAKGRAERHLIDEFGPITILRFPMVIGRRTDGAVARFSGFYQVLNGLTSGLLPAFVGRADAPVDLAPVDDIAAETVGRSLEAAPSRTVIDTIGRGVDALTTEAVITTVYEELNQWRSERGIKALERAPLLASERWDRFFLPFARQHLSPMQLKAVELFSVIHPYLAMEEPFAVSVKIADPLVAFRRSLRHWADRNPRAAAAIPVPWSSPKTIERNS